MIAVLNKKYEGVIFIYTFDYEFILLQLLLPIASISTEESWFLWKLSQISPADLEALLITHQEVQDVAVTSWAIKAEDSLYSSSAFMVIYPTTL